MVSILPLISQLASLFSKRWQTVTSTSTTVGITVTFMFHIFPVSGRIQVFVYLFDFFPFHTMIDGKFLLFNSRSNFLVWTRCSVCISKFQGILCTSFRCVKIPFVSIVKLESLAQFSLDHLLYSIMLSLMFLLCQFAASAYYVINCFVLATTLPTLVILLTIL